MRSPPPSLRSESPPDPQVLAGLVPDAMASWNRFHCLEHKFGFMPERYSLNTGDLMEKGYPLRPEFLESTAFLFEVTGMSAGQGGVWKRGAEAGDGRDGGECTTVSMRYKWRRVWDMRVEVEAGIPGDPQAQGSRGLSPNIPSGRTATVLLMTQLGFELGTLGVLVL